MTEEALGPQSQEGPQGEQEAPDAAHKLVPVNEAIKYRRRAQQAETRLQQTEQKLTDLQSQFEQRLDQLATAEAQRDELQHQLATAAVRGRAEKLFLSAGADVEAAMALLEKRMPLSAETDPAGLDAAVEGLLAEKPMLLAAPAGLPGKTASARGRQSDGLSGLLRAARLAGRSGNRRDLTEYLRLRRSSLAAS